MIYFIIADEHNYVKIGSSQQLQKRARTLALECLPCTIYMIVIPNCPYSELELLHKHGKHLYSQREWFYGNPELYQEIQHLYDTYQGYILQRSIRNGNSIPRRLPYDSVKLKAYQEYLSSDRISGYDIKRISK